MGKPGAPRKLAKADVREGFDSGAPELDEWLTRYAWQNQQANNAVTYVSVLDGRVVGYCPSPWRTWPARRRRWRWRRSPQAGAVLATGAVGRRPARAGTRSGSGTAGRCVAPDGRSRGLRRDPRVVGPLLVLSDAHHGDPALALTASRDPHSVAIPLVPADVHARLAQDVVWCTATRRAAGPTARWPRRGARWKNSATQNGCRDRHRQ